MEREALEEQKADKIQFVLEKRKSFSKSIYPTKYILQPDIPNISSDVKFS